MGLPRLSSDLVESALNSFDDVTIVGHCARRGNLAELVRSSAANVVVVGGEDSELQASCARAIAGCLPPDTVVVPVAGGDVTLVAVRRQRTNLGDVSGMELADAIRRSVAERGVA